MKRVVYAERIGDGKFIQVDNNKAGIKCAEYPALQNEIERIQALLLPQGQTPPDPPGAAVMFKCPSYAELMHKLANLYRKLWLQQIRGMVRGGTTTIGGTKPSDIRALGGLASNYLSLLPPSPATIARLAGILAPTPDPGRPGEDQ